MTNTMNYEVGDIISYRPFGGGGRRVRVTARYDDIKNGRPGFDGELVNASPDDLYTSVWGFDSQIVLEG